MENGVSDPQSELSNAITNTCGLAIFLGFRVAKGNTYQGMERSVASEQNHE